MKKNLVIVESPAKARTLARILGKTYDLKASMGHIRDLPKSQLGVEIESEFAPKYVIPREKNKLVKELKSAAKEATTIYLATDPDREGEAISWHLAEITRSNSKRFRRVVFHEITEEAIQQAFKHPRDIDMDLVNAQQARRILDRLVGYKISPLLWRKVRRGLSAGRVQSVALRIIVDREREIEKFVSVEYWSLEAELAKQQGVKSAFKALLIGHLNGNKVELHNDQEAESLKTKLEKAAYSVLKVKARTANRQPPPPFITSTLQQDAWRKLRFTAEQTMAVAQQLYEGLNLGSEGSVGLITYMRTDSTHVARPALLEAREFIEEKYGKEYVPPHARTFSATVKGAQEAHEAIRPTRIHREPAHIKQYLNNNQFRLYDLIWKRMVASQMAAAVFDNVTVDIEARCTEPRANYLFRTSSSVNRFQGFILVYTEGKDTEEEEKESRGLPPLEDGDRLDLKQLIPEQHFTQPPPRYTEATLIKTLEQFGIGRPSTYAPIISTLRDREYIGKTNGNLKPTELGIIITDLLGQYFPDIVDIQFTARMENELDEIAEHKRQWVSAVQEFYAPFQVTLDKATAEMERVKLPDEVVDETCPKCGKPMVVKTGRFGKFIACSGYPECKYTKSFQKKTGVKCPKCGTGDLIQRMSKKKKVFYGCSNYPNCDFAINMKPLPDPCPKCGGLLTVYREKSVKCTKCDYKAKLS